MARSYGLVCLTVGRAEVCKEKSEVRCDDGRADLVRGPDALVKCLLGRPSLAGGHLDERAALRLHDVAVQFGPYGVDVLSVHETQRAARLTTGGEAEPEDGGERRDREAGLAFEATFELVRNERDGVGGASVREGSAAQ